MHSGRTGKIRGPARPNDFSMTRRSVAPSVTRNMQKSSHQKTLPTNRAPKKPDNVTLSGLTKRPFLPAVSWFLLSFLRYFWDCRVIRHRECRLSGTSVGGCATPLVWGDALRTCLPKPQNDKQKQTCHGHRGMCHLAGLLFLTERPSSSIQ